MTMPQGLPSEPVSYTVPIGGAQPKKRRERPKPKPWDQRKGEPAEAFARFLEYRNLGPGRSVDAAYRLLHPSASGERAPGSWWQDSAQHDWKSRATAWDVHHLQESGHRVIATFVAALQEVAAKLLAAVFEHKPDSWAEAIETMRAIGAHIPPSTYESLHRD